MCLRVDKKKKLEHIPFSTMVTMLMITHTDVSSLQGLFGGPGLLNLQLLQTLDQLRLGVEAPRQIWYQWPPGWSNQAFMGT